MGFFVPKRFNFLSFLVVFDFLPIPKKNSLLVAKLERAVVLLLQPPDFTRYTTTQELCNYRLHLTILSCPCRGIQTIV